MVAAVAKIKILALPVHLDHRATTVFPEAQAKTARKATKDRPVLCPIGTILARLDRADNARLERKANLARLAKREKPAKKVRRAARATTANRDRPAKQAKLDHQDLRDQLAKPARKAHPARTPIKAQRDRPANPDPKENPDRPDQPATKEAPANPDHRVPLDPRVQWAPLANRATRDRLARKVNPEHLVQTPTTVRARNARSKRPKRPRKWLKRRENFEKTAPNRTICVMALNFFNLVKEDATKRISFYNNAHTFLLIILSYLNFFGFYMK